MKKLAAILMLGIYLLASSQASADDVPHMDFVKALRAKNYTDLALDYLNMLEKSGPADIKEFIPLERANILLDQAASTLDTGVRNNLYSQARSAYAAFAKARPGTPLAAIAELESARILGLQCRSALARLRYFDQNAAKPEALRIENMAIQAMQELEKAGDNIDKQAKKKDLGPKMDKALEQARLQTDLELAINNIDQAMTYELQNDQNKNLLARGKRIDRAMRDLDGLAKSDPKGTSGGLARAWLIKANHEIDQTKEAKAAYDKIANDDSPHAEAGRRMAKYFYFSMLANSTNLNPIGIKAAELPKEVQKAGEDWLRSYPSYANTFEGIVLRFDLANVLLKQAKELAPKRENMSQAAKALYERARALYSELEEGTTEFDDNVRAGKGEIQFALLGTYSIKRADIPFIKSFDQCKEYSQSEGALIDQLGYRLLELKRKPDKNAAETKELEDLQKNFETKKKEHMENAQALLVRALQVADAKVKPKDLVDVRSTLIYLMIENNDLERAAVLGEHVAMSMSDVPGAAKAAQYALEAYAKMISNGTKEGMPKEYINADRGRFKRLVEIMEGTWPNDPATDGARHYYGMQLYTEENYKEAEKVLGRISSAYRPVDLVVARYWWHRACRELIKDAKDDAEREHYRKLSMKALREIPSLAADVPADVAQVYVAAKLDQGYMLLDLKQFADVEQLALDLGRRIPTLKVDAEIKDNMRHSADTLGAYSKFGRANLELAAGKSAEALAQVDSIRPGIEKQLKEIRTKVNEIRNQKAIAGMTFAELEAKADQASKTNPPMELPDAEKAKLAEFSDKMRPYAGPLNQYSGLYRSLLLCSIRACIMGNNKARAKVEVDALNKVAEEDHLPVHDYYRQLVGEIHRQIVDLKATNQKDKLDKLVGSFVGFLDELVAKTPNIEKDIGTLAFLAHSYSSLDQPAEHEKSAALWAKVVEPKAMPPKKVDAKQEAMYRYARLQCARELRMGKKYPEARKILDDISSKDWGKGFDVRKEVSQTWMDEQKYGAAAKQWSDTIASFGKPDFSKMPAKVKENYFEARYEHIYCMYMYAKLIDPKDPKVGDKKPEYIKRAANLIVQLEFFPPKDMGGEQFRKKYDELLKKEPALFKEYEPLKKEREKQEKEREAKEAKEAKEKEAKEAKEKEAKEKEAKEKEAKEKEAKEKADANKKDDKK
jgi:hypothetical protein